ncbi:MAG TPA: hypothetical protein V6C57_04805 [Coleofasciculaceae cyanobacterium]
MPNPSHKFEFNSDRSPLSRSASEQASTEPTSRRWRNRSLLGKIALCLGLPTMLLAPAGLGLWAVTQLSGLPALPQCLTASWSDDYSARLYCAKTAADRHTVKDLQNALEWVSQIPQDNPLRPEADRLIRQWSQEVLDLGEAAYQDGKLEEAVETAEKIPNDPRVRPQADERIQHWQDTWKQAEDLYEEAQTKLNDKDWFGVLAAARRLLPLGNRYWATTQHQELMRQLQVAKDQDQKQKPTAQTKPQKPAPVSFLSQLKQGQSADARRSLNQARSLASQGDVAGLQAAIDAAQQVVFGTDSYDEAQQAISNWRQQLELAEDRPYLDRAIALASKGDEDSLQAAIGEANQISWGRALYSEASHHIDQWRDRVFQLQAAARQRQLDQMTGNSSLPDINAYPPASETAGESNHTETGAAASRQPIQTLPPVASPARPPQ